MKKLISIALCLLLCLSLSVTAFATEPVSDDVGVDLSSLYISKKLNAASDAFANIPGVDDDGAHFNVSFTSVGSATSTTNDVDDSPAITTQTIDVPKAASGDVHNGNITLEFLGGVTFPHAGEYIYTVAEVAPEVTSGTTEDGISWTLTIDSNSFEMHVFVANDGEGGTYIASVIFTDGEDKLNPVAEYVDTTSAGFENSYKEIIGNDEVDALTVTKTITGELANMDQTFEITVALTLPAGTTYADVLDADGAPLTSAAGLTVEDELGDGDSIVFQQVPVGTVITLNETQLNEYAATVSSDTNIISGTYEKGADVEDLASSAMTAATAVSIVNDNDNEILDTGVVINNLPFILLVVLAVGGLCVYFVSSRRRDDEA